MILFEILRFVHNARTNRDKMEKHCHNKLIVARIAGKFRKPAIDRTFVGLSRATPNELFSH